MASESKDTNVAERARAIVDAVEIEDFPAQIAQVALWLIDHQMNLKVSEEFGLYFARIPLTTTPHIVRDNALRLDWNEVIPAQRLSYIISNPPFSGAMVMGDSQRSDMSNVFSDVKGFGVLDYVSCWYWKAAKYIDKTSIHVGLVSTNSITQGEQVGLLWAPVMHRYHVQIQFAHRTFRWSNEAKGVAAVHCVIIGFSQAAPIKPTIFEYETVGGPPHAIAASNINAYLVDAPNVFLENRSDPICPVPPMRFGSMPRDGGYLVLNEEEKDDLLASEPTSKPFVRPYIGADEMLNNGKRWCLWLVEGKPDQLRSLPKIMQRIEAVRAVRLASKAATTRKFAATPAIFCQIAQPATDYLMVPSVSSERRKFIPMAMTPADVVASNLVFTVESAALFHFGILSSTMHMAWVRYTCGRLKSDFRYSKDIVYNNYPWPDSPTKNQSRAIEQGAQSVVDARARFRDSSLADLYDPLSMPPELVQAHEALDRAVDGSYGKRSFARKSA